MVFRIGVIGAGTHGARYARHATVDVPGMGCSAICRRSPQPGAELAAALGCRYHADPAALIADPQVDGVVVCTPPSSHFDLARAVLAAGKPLLLEKPMTGTLDQAHDLVRLADGATIPPMVAQALRWNPVLQKVKALWPRLGKVRLVRAAQRLSPTNLAWQRQLSESVGGSVLLTGVHLFDMCRWLTGAEFATVDSRQARWLNPVVEDFFLARAELSDGCWADLEVSKFTDSRAGWFEAVGECGQIQADYHTGGLVLRIGQDEEQHDISGTAPTLPPLLKAWLDTVTRACAPPVTVHDGLASLEVVNACYRSAAAGKTITLNRDAHPE